MAGSKNYSFYPFAGVPTFLRSPLATKENKLEETYNYSIGVLGVPFDEGCTFSPGSRFGPRGIREHSLRVSDMGIYDYRNKTGYLEDVIKNKIILDFGDVNIIPCDVEGNFDRITKAARKIVENNALLIGIGGDHGVTFPLVRAFHDRPIHVFHFDSHFDYLPIEPNFEFTNAHPMRQIRAMDNVQSLTHVGVRSIRDFGAIDSSADGNNVIDMDAFRSLGPEGVAALVPEGEDVYVSIDIDAYDISLVPGCGSGEPDGLFYNEMRDTLGAIAKRSHVIGFDLVEVAPLIDIRTDLTSYLGMLTIVEFLGRICDQPYFNEYFRK